MKLALIAIGVLQWPSGRGIRRNRDPISNRPRFRSDRICSWRRRARCDRWRGHRDWPRAASRSTRQSSDLGGTVSPAKGVITPAIRDWIEKNEPVW